MPGVRYGPDISDDAAYIMNRIVSLQDIEADLKKAGRKLSKRDAALLKRNTDFAKKAFGLKDSDIKARRFGDMGTLAQYSREGINLSRRKRGANGKWIYEKSKRAKFARKGGTIQKRTIKEEHDIRGSVPSRTTVSARDKSRIGKQATKVGGGTYLGFTAPKQFREARKRFYDRVGKKGPISYGTSKARRVRNEDDLDRLNIARNAQGRSLRPRLVTSRPGGRRKAAAPTKAQAKRTRQIQTAGRGRGKMSTAKKVTKAKRPRR